MRKIDNVRGSLPIKPTRFMDKLRVFIRAQNLAYKTEKCIPTVFSHTEAVNIIHGLSNPWQLIAQLMYGSYLRTSEAIGLRVKDLDFNQGVIIARKYPTVSKELAWQYLFPSTSLSKDPRTNKIRRHHVYGPFIAAECEKIDSEMQYQQTC